MALGGVPLDSHDDEQSALDSIRPENFHFPY